MSGFRGSTAIFSKYQPRPQSDGSPESFAQVAPASSERNTPPWPCALVPKPAGLGPAPGGGSGVAPPAGVGPGRRQSMTAYTRRGLLGAIAIPLRPIPSAGSPAVSSVPLVPPPVDLKSPPPGPLVGG